LNPQHVSAKHQSLLHFVGHRTGRIKRCWIRYARGSSR
jgi:hypothetical protein